MNVIHYVLCLAYGKLQMVVIINISTICDM